MPSEKIEEIAPPAVQLKVSKGVPPQKAAAFSSSANVNFGQAKPFLSGKPLRQPRRPNPPK